MLTLVLAGGMGRMQCNLRGIFKHCHKDEDPGFPARVALPFVIGPGTGAMVGLTIFFVATLLNAALRLRVRCLTTRGFRYTLLRVRARSDGLLDITRVVSS
jgi:hypothetical protein